MTSLESSSWFSSFGFSAVLSPGSVHSCGCVILYRPSLTLIRSWCDDDGCYLQCEFSLRDKVFRVVCLYSPNRNPARDLFLEDLHLKVDLLIPTLLTGDFACVFDRALDRRGSDPSDSSRESSATLSHMFDVCCITDIWRYLHPSSPGFTWLRWDGSRSSRIDLLGIHYAWVPSVSSCSVFVCPSSDHRGVSVSISLPDAVPPGPGFWKLNMSILDDPVYVFLVEDAWGVMASDCPPLSLFGEVVGPCAKN